MKTCLMCQDEKPAGDFYAHPKTKDRLQPYCRPCSLQRRADWAKANPEKAAAAHRKANDAYRRRLRVRAVEHLGGACARCGITEPRLLEIDHVDGGGRQENRAIGNHGVHLRILRGAPGYQLLCSNCHTLKTYEACLV